MLLRPVFLSSLRVLKLQIFSNDDIWRLGIQILDLPSRYVSVLVFTHVWHTLLLLGWTTLAAFLSAAACVSDTEVFAFLVS